MTLERTTPLIAAAAGALLALTSFAAIAATPKPPAQICVDGNCTTAAAPSQRGVKWHPGSYAWYSPTGTDGVPGHRIDLPYQKQQMLDFVDRICGESSIKGIQIVAMWRTLEGDTAGDYSPGFNSLDPILAKLAGCGKRMMLTVQTVWFGNIRSAYDILPRYIVDQSQYRTSSLISPTAGIAIGTTARTWQQATVDRVIALAQAYGARYNGNPNFEMITLGETSLQVPDGTDGYSVANNLTQMKRIVTAARAAFPNTALRIGANDMGNDSNLVDLFAHCAINYCAVGGPDVWPGDITQADRIFVGLNQRGEKTYIDYSDQLPWAVEVQWQSFSGRWTIQQLYDAPLLGYAPANGDFRMPSMKVKYQIWYVNEVNGTAATQWNTAILPFLRSKNGAVYSSTCPTKYPACIT